ncbi:MAG: DNA cytosine methyltransferase [Acidobacteria bacterium]|nr:DNA cytosine methyltransferase [Acidobacteriota bacterium]MBI3427582.1 DNA cytosine methyltransferase [Acidobacteriota bacterium]
MRRPISAIDLFCGAGGLTHGLRLEGIDVRVGIDLDPACEYPFKHNNTGVAFLPKDVTKITADQLRTYIPENGVTLLAGCAPCQPFSTYSQGHRDEADNRWTLLREFARLAEELCPDVVTMENVPKLEEHEVFADFVSRLKSLGYHVTHSVVDCRYYGVPQHRKRLVLFASRYGEIKLQPPTHSENEFVTVRQTIEKLEKIVSGETSTGDSLHRASLLTEKNLQRIRASKPGGTWRDWERKLRTKCHRKKSGKTYPSVYGRMTWDEPAPTMTTQCYGFGNGRFGHPEQDRAISLREAALIQTFPAHYAFAPSGQKVSFKKTGRLIGNAVPVELARVIANSILNHIDMQGS